MTMEKNRLVNGTDSHFHASEMARKGMDVQKLLGEAIVSGMKWLVDVGVTEDDFEERSLLAKEFPGLFLACGIHPSYSGGDVAERMSRIEKQLSEEKVVAVGETGLDFYRNDRDTIKVQREFLLAHIDLAVKYSLPLIIHSRNASEELLSVMKEITLPAGGVMHCFSGDVSLIDPFLEKGFYFSFAGNLTFKNAQELRDSVKKIPKERLLIETDAPFLSPEPHRGRPSHPGCIGDTLSALAEILSLQRHRVFIMLRENFERLYNVT